MTMVPVLPVVLEEGVSVRTNPRSLKSVAFDLSLWHAGPVCERSFVSGVGGIGVKVCCAPCGVLCDVEGTGQRITVAQSFYPLQTSTLAEGGP